MWDEINVDKLIEKAAAEKVEITITYSPDGATIEIAPWQPLNMRTVTEPAYRQDNKYRRNNHQNFRKEDGAKKGDPND